MKHDPMNNALLAMIGLALACLAYCGDFAMDESSGGAPSEDNQGPARDASQDGATSDLSPGADASSEPFIPEDEDDYRMQLPVASRSYVFVANTSLNAVAKIDSLTLQITTIEVGLEPTIVRTSPTGDTAVVLNEGSDDLSVILTGEGDRVVFIDVIPGANSLILSPNGDFAMAYYDNAIAESGDQHGSLSDVTLVRLDADPIVAHNLVVGLHIREVEFDDTGETAYFVTDDGIAVVDLDSVDRDRFVPPVQLSLDPLDDPLAIDREVEVTADGAFALVRSSAASTLRLVDLATQDIVQLELAAIPTDLDLLPSGNELVAVLREASEIVVIPMPGGFEDPGQIVHIDLGEEVIGLAQIIGQSRMMACFSSIGENDHLSIVDLDDHSIETYALRKGIEAIHVSPDGQRLLVMHTKLPGDPVPGTDSFLANSFAFTVFNMEYRIGRMVFTDARPGQFTFSADGQMVFILTADEAEGVMAVKWTNLATGRDSTIPLRRMPESIGLIPSTGRIYVSEEHEVGRMAFIDPATGEVREVTGYHLNSRTE